MNRDPDIIVSCSLYNIDMSIRATSVNAETILDEPTVTCASLWNVQSRLFDAKTNIHFQNKML